jgi:replicative DNA helicase
MDNKTDNKTIQRIPPHDVEAEQAILSCMLYDADAVATCFEIIKSDDFYRPDYKAIFEAMSTLFIKNVPVDAVTVKDKLVEMGVLEQIGGIEALSILATGFYTTANVRYYSKIIEEKAILRKLIKASADISGESFEAKQTIEDILDNAEKKIFDIRKKRNTTEFHHIKDVLVESINSIEKVYLSSEQITGIPTGFIDFDIKTSGLQRSDLILIAARPSMGKTAFALNIVQHAAVRKSASTAIFSLEMSKEQLVNRLISAESMLDAQKLRTGNLNDNDWIKIIEGVESLSNANLYIDDTPGISVAEVRTKCRKLKLEKGLDLVVIDYLQLMSGRGESRQQEISEISRQLKSIAREMEAPVIALSQLSRACEQRADHRPMLSDLRESGAIEQDADVVAFLYRDEYYNPETEKKNQAEVIIAKQRNGPTGTVDLTWLGQFTKFTNMAKDYV